ncbi:hypothetical protein [Streptomyces sp. NRRL S-378]|uniref:hypothetical protein n=1 Tax=Streptomyces sp. NRRL S-378 TaxID=1463904 RepID=UPI0004C7C90C|nr:hypothetical protein [Streptomyces sp. NRRL S-378]
MSGRAGAPLWRQLLRIGILTGRGASAGRIRAVALVCATFALSLVLGTLVLIHAAYEGRDARDAARAPVQIAEGSTQQARLLYKPVFDVVDKVQYQVVYIAPLTPDAPVPPGLSAWPEPGQAALSPALLKAGRAEGIATRFGTLAGTIDAQDLASPEEWFAYVRPPANADTARMWASTGFGTPGPLGVGEGMFTKPAYILFALTAFMGALPVSALIAAAARSGSDARDQRTALLEALGGGRRVRAAVHAGEAALPIAAGAVLGLTASCWILTGDTRIPLTGYAIAGADTQRWAGALLSAPVMAAVIVLACVVLLHPQQDRRDGVRPRLFRTRLPRWWPYLCPFLLFVAVQGPGLTSSSGTRLLVYVIGVGGTILTLPSLIGLAAVATGNALASISYRRGWPGALLAGRWAAAWPGATVRLTAGVVIAFVLVGQTQLWATLNTGPAVQAQHTVQKVGSSVVLVSVNQDKPVPQPFLDELPDGVETLRLKLDPTKATAELSGACTALQRLSLACTQQPTVIEPNHPDARLQALATWDTPGQGIYAKQSAQPEGPTLVLIGDKGRDLSVPTIKAAANRHLGMAVPVETVAGSWLTAANMDDLNGRWVMLYGTFAVIIVIISIMVTNLAEFLRFARQVTAVSVLAGNRTIYFSTAFFTLLTPLAAAALIGLFMHHWLATPIRAAAYTSEHTETGSMLHIALAGAGIMAVTVWLWGAWGATRLAHSWRPSAD